MPKTKIITRFLLDEVSGVDDPANPLAQVGLWKKKNGGPQMDIEALQKSVEESTAKVSELTGQVEVLTKASEAATTLVESLTKSLKDNGFEVKVVDGVLESVEKAADPETVVIDGETVLKSAVPAPVLRMLEKQAKDLEKLNGDAETVRLSKRAQTELPNLGGTDQERGLLLKAIDGIEDEEVQKSIHKALKAADTAVAKMFDEVGGHDPDESDDAQKLNKMASEYAKENSVSLERAMVEVSKSGEGRELMKKVRYSGA